MQDTAAAKRAPSGIFARPEFGASRIPVARKQDMEETNQPTGLGNR